MNVHKIISFDSNKVWFEFKDGIKICKKRTIGKEVEALIQAKEYLNGKKINALGKEYSLSTPNVMNWEENTGILTMSFCEGENLESIICNSKTREQGVELLRERYLFQT
jgi:tRNA A-37 threonylcarbamoyl transferase component Bud32